jgi:hypothetical protein
MPLIKLKKTSKDLGLFIVIYWALKILLNKILVGGS